MENNIWDELYSAAKSVLSSRKISEWMEAGGVAAAIESESGKIYTGVCVDGACHPRNLRRAKRNFQYDNKRRKRNTPRNRRKSGRKSHAALRCLPRAYGAANARKLQEYRGNDELRRKKNCHLRRAHPAVVDMKGNFYMRQIFSRVY